MRYLLLFFAFGLFLLSCRKEETENDTNTLKQFIEFSINGETIKFIENDSISFIPSWAFKTDDTDTNYLFYISSTIQIEHNKGNYSNYSNHSLVFYSKIHSNQTQISSDAFSEKLLKPGVFNSLFFPDQIDYLKQNCYDSISNGLFVTLVFRSFEGYEKNYISFFNGCDEIEEDVYNNHDNSYFNIDEVQSLDHKNYGESLLLTGTFGANLFADPITEESNLLKCENGKFRILISDPSNVDTFDK